MTTYAGLYGPEALIDGTGHPITSATIDVFTHGTTTHVSLYQDNARVTPLSNPVPNGVDGSTAGRGLDTYGNLSFYIDPGRYDLRIATGAGTRTVEIEIETDPAESAASVPAGGTTAQVLKKNSNTDFDAGWGDAAQLSNATPLISAGAGTPGTGTAASRNDHVHPAPAGLAAGLPINYYVAVATARNASNAFTLNTEYCWAFILPGSGTLDSLSIDCTVLGDAGSVLRWGVRQDNGGLPSATVAAQGTVVATSTGYKTVTGLSIPYGSTNSGILWLSLVWQGGTSVSPQVEACDKGGGFSAGPLAAALAAPGGAAGHVLNIATQTGVTGALPATVPAAPGTTQWTGDIPHIWLRRSA